MISGTVLLYIVLIVNTYLKYLYVFLANFKISFGGVLW